MNTLQKLSNEQIVCNLQNLVGEERAIGVQILWNLKETERRQIPQDKGYSDIFDFCVKFLKYSKGSAYRRVSSMRLLKEVPQVEQALKQGDMNLTTASLLQNFFQIEKKQAKKTYTSEQKQSLLQEVVGKSKTECEKLLCSKSPQFRPHSEKDKVRIVSETKIEVKYLASNRLIEKLTRIKELTAHKNPNPTHAELLEMMADSILERIDPERKVIRKKSSPENQKQAQNPRYISAVKKHEVWKKFQGQCAYIDPKTKRRCESRFGLEIDHKLPVALGGTADPNNLRLLCKQHNLFVAMQILGPISPSLFDA